MLAATDAGLTLLNNAPAWHLSICLFTAKTVAQESGHTWPAFDIG